jgi:hypothetical protein
LPGLRLGALKVGKAFSPHRVRRPVKTVPSMFRPVFHRNFAVRANRRWEQANVHLGLVTSRKRKRRSIGR